MSIRAPIRVALWTAALLCCPAFAMAQDQRRDAGGIARTQNRADVAIQDCQSLRDSAAAELCEATVRNRVATYDRLNSRLVGDIQEMTAIHDRILRSIPESQPSRANTAGTERRPQPSRALTSRLVTRIQTGTAAAVEAQTYLHKSLPATARLFVDKDSDVSVICDLHDTGQITCIELSVLLASHTNRFGELILSDIARLQEIFELPIGDEILIGCGPGMWSSMGLPDTGAYDSMAGLNAFMTATGFDQVLSRCTQLMDSMTPSGAQSLMNAGGSSGLTGFDPLGMTGLCGLEPYESDAAEFTRNALALAEEMREGCEATLQSTMMDATSNADLPNGKDENGNAKPIKTATAITQNGDGTETVETIDGDGGQITEVRQSTSNLDSIRVEYQDGSTGYASTGPDGYSSWYNNPDGSGASVTINKDGTTWGVRWDSEGNITEETEIDPTDPFSSEYLPLSPPLDPGSLRESFESACVGEPCSSCFDFNQLNPKLQEAAENGAPRDLWILRRFGLVAQCCGDEAAFAGDPRVAIVNPEADFMCAGGADAEAESAQAACAARCSVAMSHSGDCMSSCLEGYDLSGGLNLSTLDIICHQTISEACFIRQGNFEIPPPRPLPLPESMAKAQLLIEPFISWQAREMPERGIGLRRPERLFRRQP